MGFFIWIAIGLIVSICTLAIENYVNRRHIPITIGLGVAGAIVGGVFSSFIFAGIGQVKGLYFMIAIWAYLGSVLFLTIYREIEQA
jgi:uncharacterized membrane protein YeaQ/YmgE (transglycosylase-associated protein family)